MPRRAESLAASREDLPCRPRVYAAHPKACYGTAHAASCVARLAELLPGAEIVDPETLRWRTEDQWRRSWPRVLGGLSSFVVFAGTDGTIGAGCIRELTDALVRHIPIAGFHEGSLRTIEGIELLPIPFRSARSTALLLLADPIDPDKFVPNGEPQERTFP
ncbi:MAG: hypothetical protein ABSF89_18955 [Acidimicrobiales bacterium]|jgi:hypothetical protein